MGLITKEVILKPKGKAASYYKNLGYNWLKGESITVPICDLQIHSNIPVQCICDYCSNEFMMTYNSYNRAMNSIVQKLSCEKCGNIKQSEVLMITYGVTNISQIPGVTEKKIQTNISKYGMLYTQTDECKQKVINTNIQKYGIPFHALNDEVQQKKINTNISRYGASNPFGNSKVKEKITNTKYKNGLVATSKQQEYICNLYHMKLNYPIKKWNVDMIDLENRLVTEFDGGGHFLQVKLGSMTLEDFKQRERVRELMIKREGYKMMRIISRKDYLPSDAVLLQMLSITTQYFSDFPQHSWIKFDIDNGIVRNTENMDGVLFDYGKLRKIKAYDLKSA